MIKLNNRIILNDYISFRQHFNLDEMLPLARRISEDKDLFINDDNLREIQRTLQQVIKTDEGSVFKYEMSGDQVSIKMSGEEYVVKHTPSENFNSLKDISRGNMISLLISELGGRECNLNVDENIAYIGISNKDPLSSIVNEINTNDVIRIIGYNRASTIDNTHIEMIAIRNNTEEGFSRIIFNNSDNSNELEYKIEAGNCVFMLKINGYYINKIPQFSVGKDHVIYMSYSENNKVNVCSIGYGDNQANDYCHQFEALELMQICADEQGGFIALNDGKIISYSNEIQPYDVDNLMQIIPSDEKIVMLQLISRQIYALTDKMTVYSNSPIKIENNGSIIWIEKNENKQLVTISKENFVCLSNVDKQTIDAKVITYNNGKIN